MAREAALEAVTQLGAHDPQVQVSMSKHHLPDAVDDNGLLEAVIRAEAIGRPETGLRRAVNIFLSMAKTVAVAVIGKAPVFRVRARVH